jgi:hypothetical protein
MIFNAFTIIIFFIALLTGILALILAAFSFRIYQRWGKSLSDQEKSTIENRSYLLLLIAVVILSVKLLSWPLFYVTLQSYIPNIQGAMCIFGVTQAQPHLSSIAQIFKPVVFFFIGGWLLLNALDRTTERAPLFKRKFLFLSFVSFMVLGDSVSDFVFLTSFSTEADIACCTTFFDLPERTTAMLPISILGKDYERYMLPLYYLSNISLFTFTAISYIRLSPGRLFRYTIMNSNVLCPMITGAVLSLLNAAITVIALFEVIAPKIMELPYHHCIYCMWQYVPDSIVMTGLFIIGTFSLNWALLLYITGKHKETVNRMKEYIRNLYFLGLIGIGVSMVMVTIHIFIKG